MIVGARVEGGRVEGFIVVIPSSCVVISSCWGVVRIPGMGVISVGSSEIELDCDQINSISHRSFRSQWRKCLHCPTHLRASPMSDTSPTTFCMYTRSFVLPYYLEVASVELPIDGCVGETEIHLQFHNLYFLCLRLLFIHKVSSNSEVHWSPEVGIECKITVDIGRCSFPTRGEADSLITDQIDNPIQTISLCWETP